MNPSPCSNPNATWWMGSTTCSRPLPSLGASAGRPPVVSVVPVLVVMAPPPPVASSSAGDYHVSYSSVTMAGTTERRRLPVAERRELITEAAGRLFGERGYEGTRLDDVAAAAGVTKPVLYRHFDSKRELYLALLARHRDDLPTFVGAAPTEGSLREWLRAILESWLEYVETHSYAWQMLFRDSGGGPEVQAFRREVHARA